MADEVAENYPDAVFRHADGYLRVDYSQLFRDALVAWYSRDLR